MNKTLLRACFDRLTRDKNRVWRAILYFRKKKNKEMENHLYKLYYELVRRQTLHEFRL